MHDPSYIVNLFLVAAALAFRFSQSQERLWHVGGVRYVAAFVSPLHPIYFCYQDSGSVNFCGCRHSYRAWWKII
ncbi:hypothetical protein BC937DRAFT_86191 [Endogone sp. FLAS-F59071]|nr:hypothetical protein BC937DRAFT_86191 [Endogone sp. FLAS-F59071]|eukprot:RUS13186.1 hypothetical protein BC937DRAFT_86191 [Endogone sp. FLAS-F59071]